MVNMLVKVPKVILVIEVLLVSKVVKVDMGSKDVRV